MLQATGITKHFGVDAVLEGVELIINRRDRIGFIGANGAGKTTFLKILLGELEPDAGQVIREGTVTVGYLAQSGWAAGGRTVRAEARAGFPTIEDLRARLEAVEQRLAALPANHPDLDRLVAEHGELEHAFDDAGGYRLETDLEVILGGLGFRRADLDRPASEFSGGWQMRIGLGRLLLQKPDLLLLDEPTNHLDLAAVEWLEGYLRDYPGAFLLVSHDRYFLDRVTARTVELAGGRVADYAGNYSYYVAEKERRRAAQQAAYDRQQLVLAHQQIFIDRFRAKATKASAVKSREKALERIERFEAPDAATAGPKVAIAHAGRTGRRVLATRDVTQAYGGREVLHRTRLEVERGDRLALLGPNGAGKSTLLRILAGVEAPVRGEVETGHNVRRLYYRQNEADSLDPNLTAVDAVRQETALTEGAARSILGRFLFTGDDSLKPVGALSGGERVRVALARLLTRQVNVLLLDEPTNHLDVATREALEAALLDFPGTVVIATHDRYLIDRLATRIAEVADGQVRLYDETYAGYRLTKAAETAAPAPVAAEPSDKRAAPNRPRKGRPGVRAGDVRRDLAAAERRVEELEQSLAELAGRLNDPALYADHQQAQVVLADHERLTAELEAATARWEELMLLSEELAAD